MAGFKIINGFVIFFMNFNGFVIFLIIFKGTNAFLKIINGFSNFIGFVNIETDLLAKPAQQNIVCFSSMISFQSSWAVIGSTTLRMYTWSRYLYFLNVYQNCKH